MKRLLDLFCGAGGAAMGYSRAGFEVTGVDIHPQPHYPFTFVQAEALTYPLNGFDVIHASPPCQLFSVASLGRRRAGKVYVDYLSPIRERLLEHGGLWIIENVPGSPLRLPVLLCGEMFGLSIFRHRLFETSHLLLSMSHSPHRGKIGEGYFSVAGGAGRWKSCGTVKRDVSKGTVTQWRQALGISWMTGKELTQAIPPAYTEYLGRQLIAWLGAG